MSYENPNRMTIVFANTDFGGGADIAYVLPTFPKGCRIWDLGVLDATEAMNGDTLDPAMVVGDGSDEDAFIKSFSLSDVGDNESKSLRDTILSTAADPSTYFVKEGKVPRASGLVLTCKAGTGANLTGQAKPYIVIDRPW